MTIPDEPPVPPLDVEYDPAAEPLEVSEAVFAQASVGDWLLVAEGQRLPDGWVPTDKSFRESSQFPTFVEIAGIVTPTFRLPARPARPGHQWVVRLR